MLCIVLRLPINLPGAARPAWLCMAGRIERNLMLQAAIKVLQAKSETIKVDFYRNPSQSDLNPTWIVSTMHAELLCSYYYVLWRGNGALQKLHASKDVLLLPCNLPSLVISEIVRWTWSLPLLPAASFLPRQHPTMSGFAVPGGRIKQHATESPPKKRDIEKDSESQSYRKKLEKGKWSSQSSRSNIGSS